MLALMYKYRFVQEQLTPVAQSERNQSVHLTVSYTFYLQVHFLKKIKSYTNYDMTK